MYDLQRAGIWKRFSAALFDLILLVTVTVGVALLLSTVLGYDGYMEELDRLEEQYAIEYGLDLDITADEMAALSEEERQAYELADEAFGSDPAVAAVYDALFTLAMLVVTFSILIAFLLMEFLIPLLLGNGQTLGKKIFGIAVMRIDGVKLPPILLFARTILGKYTIGTMVPVYVAVLTVFNILGISGVVIIGALVLVQAILFFGTREHTPIHDKLAQTVTVDMATQLIFDTPEDLLEYKKRIHAEAAEKRER